MLDQLKCTRFCSMPNVILNKSAPPPASGPVEGGPQRPDRDPPDQTVLGSADVVEVKLPPENFNICSRRNSRTVGHEHGDEKSKEEVIKQIAFSSTAFIGPACRPATAAAAIEEELSEFYKELEEINHQHRTDGDTGVSDNNSQSAPTLSPSSRTETQGAAHKSAYRPYPLTRPQSDCGNSWKWRQPPRDDMTRRVLDSYNSQAQWLPPPPRLPQGPPGIRFHGPQRFFPPPPPRNPLHPPHFQPQRKDYSHAWEGPQFPAGYDTRFSPSYCSGSFRSSYDWQHYEEHTFHEEDQHQHNSGMCSVLILLRGVPGSGKSTLAKEILSGGPNGLILSTDDYFFQEDGYLFDPTLLGDAHDWNQKRARDAMLRRRSPVVIDNTNVQAWEMKPYVALALEFGYRVEFVEPETSWKYDPAELEKRNKHGVPRETIAKMLDRFELPVSVDVVMNSFEPPHKSKERLFNKHGRFEDV